MEKIGGRIETKIKKKKNIQLVANLQNWKN